MSLLPPTDPHRPVRHFTTDQWMNDPIPFFYGGSYHIFFQHNPDAAVWGNMHWGHARSEDLCRWERLPIALAPTPGGPDSDGVWTGCVTHASGQPVALYTGIPAHPTFKQVVCLASSQDLISWQKEEEAPLSVLQPENYGPCFRDPQTFERGDGQRYMLIGGELPEKQGGVAFLYRATDPGLKTWEYLHPLFEGSTGETGHEFECPDFFPMENTGERWLLLTSHGKTWWHSGHLTEELRFHRESWGACDTGSFYAAKTLRDDRGRRLLFGWITETRPREEQIAAGWSGVLSFPREVSPGPEGRPRFTPPVELDSFRIGLPLEQEFSGVFTLPSLPPLGELRFHFRERPLSLLLQYSDAQDAQDAQDALRLTAPLPTSGEEGTVILYLDHSVVEAFINGESCHTFRIYPRNPGRVLLSGEGRGTVRVWSWEPD